MPDDQKPEKPPKRDRRRRNFAKIIGDLEAYCLATIDIIESHPATEFGAGQKAMAERILEKVKG